jgi:pimeloyl-ACP methyl ester carboxylesterase
MRRWVLLLIASLCCGCTTTRNKPMAPPPVVLYPMERATGVVFCADGSGGPGGTTSVVRYVVDVERAPLRVEMVDWSHGKGRYLADHLHWANIERAGEQLAQQAKAVRLSYPDKRICFVGQSAGCAVVLVAAESLPAGVVDRVVLLAPSVSSRYDLRPALGHSGEGIDVFYSRRDWFVLGLGMALSGTTDRDLAPAAGRVGFREVKDTPQDAALYLRLRQYEWEPGAVQYGNDGTHFGPSSAPHVQQRVLPMLLGTSGGR